MSDVAARVDAVWRIESARVVATLTRYTGDLGMAEDLAQDALADALVQWPGSGVPDQPGAWLTAVAKRKAIDAWRRADRLDARYRQVAHDLEQDRTTQDVAEAWEPIEDDVLRLIFTACHPVLAREAQVALTLKVVAGLTTEEIARLLLVPVPTVQQRIVRAKKALGAAKVPFEVPDQREWPQRLGAVLGVVYLLFTEGYAPTSGDAVVRRDVAAEALRLGRVLTGLVPREPEAHALVALMELQASRFGARVARDGTPVLLEDQDRARWDRSAIRRGLSALAASDALGRGRGPYALQAAIAACHAVAPSVAESDWAQIVDLYGALEQLSGNPVVGLNRAIAVSMADGPEPALAIVDELAEDKALAGSHLVPSVRGELLTRLGRYDEARQAFDLAIERATNDAQRAVLEAKRAVL